MTTAATLTSMFRSTNGSILLLPSQIENGLRTLRGED